MSNSGTESWDKTEEITEEKFDHVFNLNARAQFFVGQAAWRHLEDRMGKFDPHELHCGGVVGREGPCAVQCERRWR